MAKTVDFIQQTEERRKETERAEHGGLTAEEYQKKMQADALNAIKTEQSKDEAVVEEAKKRAGFVASDTDHTDDTDPLTGRTRINGQELGSDSATGGAIPPNGNNGNGTVPPNGNSGNGANNGTPAPQIPTPAARAKFSRKDFMPKGVSFFKADVRDGFWQTLEDKLEKALQGKSTEEVAENMFFSAVELFFDMLNNAIDHHRRDKERRNAAADKAIEGYENQIGLTRENKRVIEFMVLAHRQGIQPDPETGEYPPLTKEQEKAMFADSKTGDFKRELSNTYEQFSGIKPKEKDIKKDLKSMRKDGFAGIMKGASMGSEIFKTMGDNKISSAWPEFSRLNQIAEANRAEKEGIFQAQKDLAKARYVSQHQQGQQPQQQFQPRTSGRDAA